MSRHIPPTIGEMTEYRHSAHATFDLKYHVVWCTKASIQDSGGASGRACARPDTSGVPESRGSDYPGSGVSGSCPYAAVGATGSVACETGAVHQRSYQPNVASGISRVAKAVLGTAYVGAVDEATIKAYIEN